MAIPIKLKGTASKFQTQDFTPTQWATAEEKAKIANKMTRFILGGFQQGSFTKAMYQRLSNMFCHIAHYNINGFYENWFSDIKAVFYKLKSAQFIIEKVPTLKVATLKLLSKRGPLYYRKVAQFCPAPRAGDKILLAQRRIGPC